MFSAFPFAFLYFGTYNFIKNKFIEHYPNINIHAALSFAGAFSEGFSNVIRTPFEVVKQ
jgi:hypothetical protein